MVVNMSPPFNIMGLTMDEELLFSRIEPLTVEFLDESSPVFLRKLIDCLLSLTYNFCYVLVSLLILLSVCEPIIF